MKRVRSVGHISRGEGRRVRTLSQYIYCTGNGQQDWPQIAGWFLWFLRTKTAQHEHFYDLHAADIQDLGAACIHLMLIVENYVASSTHVQTHKIFVEK